MKTKIKERSIPFSVDGVRGLLDNALVPMTMTRRLMGLKHVNEHPDNWHLDGDCLEDRTTGERIWADSAHCPYGKVGEHLWCTEQYWQDERDKMVCLEADRTFRCSPTENYLLCRKYNGTVNEKMLQLKTNPFWHKHSARFMPHWASRLDLEIVSSKVQRLHDISREEIRAEGIILPMSARFTPNDKFSELHQEYIWWWDSMNKKRGYPFSGNFWTWLIGVRRVKK
jgi:hypothetical protein